MKHPKIVFRLEPFDEEMLIENSTLLNAGDMFSYKGENYIVKLRDFSFDINEVHLWCDKN